MSWQILELQEIESLRRKLVLLLEKEFVTDQVNVKITEMSGKMNMKGFRPGKIPTKVIRRKFGESIEGEVVQEQMQKSFEEALKDKKLRIAVSHEMKPVEPVDSGWKLEAEFDIFPEIELINFSELKVTEEKASITDAQIDERQEQWRQFMGSFQVQDRPAKKDDMLLIKVEVKDAQGVVVEKEREKTIILGSEHTPVSVSDALQDQKAKFTCQVSVESENKTESSEKPDATMNTWDIELINVQERIIPQWDEESIKKLGFEPATIENLRDQVKQQIDSEMTSEVDSKLEGKLIALLVSEHDFELPKAMVEREVEGLKAQQSSEASENNPDEDKEKAEAETKDSAMKRVKTSLIFGAIAEKYDIQPDVDWLRETIESQASQYPDPEQFKQMMYGNENYMKQLQAKAMEVSVMKQVRSEATVEIIEKAADDSAVKTEPQTLTKAGD